MCSHGHEQVINLVPPRQKEPLPELDRYINIEEGLMSRKVFWEQGIYEQELEKIFARAWLFLAHDSQIPKAGDYVTTTMGEDDVIVVRQKDGSVKAFLNTCPHRGNRVCFSETGNARGFICNYHGWSFGIDGALKGVHESGAYEASGFDKSKHGLHPVAQVDSYKGLIFGTLDPTAPGLTEYLGDFAWYLDVLLDMDGEGTEFIGGCTRSTMKCNWKFGAENFVGDILHAGWTHDSGAKAMLGGPVAELGKALDSYHVNVNGHGWEFNLDKVGNAGTFGDKQVLKYLHGIQPKVAERLGHARSMMIGAISSATIFPNLSFLPGQNTFRVWQPRGPDHIELYTWTIVNKSAPEEIKERFRRGSMITFSPSGVFEMDDGENWEYATRANRGRVTREQDLYLGLGLGTRIEHPEFPGNVFQGQINEANQRAYYQRWLDFMKAMSWDEIPQR
jgi:ethylbenzene dioxygenase alpha subunit